MGDRFCGSLDGERSMERGERIDRPVEVAGGDADSAGALVDRRCLAPATEFLLYIFGGCGDIVDGPCL